MSRLNAAFPALIACALLATPLEDPTAAPAAATSSPGPTLAREDTMYTSVPEVLVRAPRVTLEEILDRIARGERRRDSLLVDQSFVATMRIMHARDDVAPAELLEESVQQVYRKKPNKVRSVLLRKTIGVSEKQKRKQEQRAAKAKAEGKTLKPDKRNQVQVNFRADMSEEIVNFAFRPDARRDYRYHIAGRDIIGDHVIYRIHFEPKSLLDPGLPSGLVWVDTNDFVILRQELEFERSPLPLVLKNIDRMVIERQHVGAFWMLHKVLMRAHFTVPMPQVGRRMDVSLQFDNWALNTGLPDSLFIPGAQP